MIYKQLKDHDKGGKEKKDNLAAQSSLIGLAGALLLGSEAAAQTSNGVDLLSLDGVTSAILQNDGSLSVTLNSGQEYTIPAGSFESKGDVFLVSQNILDTLTPVAPAAVSSGGVNIGLIGLGVAALGGIAAVAASGGGGDDAPPPPPAPAPVPPNDVPVLSSASSVSAAENQTAVQTAVASDADGDMITFSLTGTDAALFNIDATTGVITFAAPPNFEMPGDSDGDNVFDIVVNASDGTATTTQNLAVTVTDVNEAPILMATTAVTVAENQTAVQTPVASDVDGDMLTFSLTGVDAGQFNIDAATGTITFATPPDFEMPSDADGNNVFNLIVNVTDSGGLTANQLVVIMVTDVNEAPAVTGAVAVSAATSQSSVQTVTAITAPSSATSVNTNFEDDVMMDDPMEIIDDTVFVPMDMFEIA